MASPVLIEEGAIKYIDYDLDVKVFRDGGFKVLDRKEYAYHRNKMQYSKRLDSVIHIELNDLIQKVKAKNECFSKETIEEYYQKYMKMKKSKK